MPSTTLHNRCCLAAWTAIACLLLVGCTSQHHQHPASFTDHVPAFNDDKYPVPFEMLLIPGDKAKGIEPFYIGQTEVTWNMMRDWMYDTDLEHQGATAREMAELEMQGLRPSPLYGELVLILFANEDTRPACGVSWRTAQTFCLWLSEQTGRTYRLPTDEEWMHVFHLSGGIPVDPKILSSQAIFANTGGDNTGEQRGNPYFADYITRPIKSKQPNKLGLYDLLGNVAEWVQPTDDQRWVRGGHFALDTNKFTPDWQGIEDQEVWNASYPQLPRSQSWYFDEIFQGIRLVCEVQPSSTE